MKEKILILLLILLPFLIIVVAFLLPVVPYVLFSILVIFLALIFGSVHKWDDSMFAEKIVDILKMEAAITVFGISLGSLVLGTLSQVINIQLITGILLMSSGFFVFSMIFGVLHLLMKGESSFRRYVGWSMIISLLYGLFFLLLGWSFVLKPIIDTLLNV